MRSDANPTATPRTSSWSRPIERKQWGGSESHRSLQGDAPDGAEGRTGHDPRQLGGRARTGRPMKQPHRAMGIVHRFISSAEPERPRQTHASPGSPHPKVPTIPAIKKSQPLPGTRELYHRRQQHGGQDRMASATQDSTMHSQATQRRRVHWWESWSPLSSRSSAPISVGA